MFFSFSKPHSKRLDHFLDSCRQLSFSYRETGASSGQFPVGFNHDRNTVRLGEGEDVFVKAKTALFQWAMFPPGWTTVYTSGRPLEKNRDVAVLFRLFGLWWVNGARIVYLVDEPQKAGFAYGTLSNHIECGEELFYVEMQADGSVWYGIQAFSRPRFLPARLAYPLARYFQHQFVKKSLLAMKDNMLENGQN